MDCKIKSQWRKSKRNRKRFFSQLRLNLRHSKICFPQTNFCFHCFSVSVSLSKSDNVKLWTTSFLWKSVKLNIFCNSACSLDIKKYNVKITAKHKKVGDVYSNSSDKRSCFYNSRREWHIWFIRYTVLYIVNWFITLKFSIAHPK